MLSDVAVVPNVSLKSAKTRTVPPQIQLKALNMLESQQNTRKTMSIGMRPKGHPFPISVTVFAHAEQKRAHGTMLRRHVEPVGRLGTFEVQSAVFCLNAAVQFVIVFVHKATGFLGFFRTYETSCHDN